jgi:hypothetical protein
MKLLITESQLKALVREQTSDEWGGTLADAGINMTMNPKDFTVKNIAKSVYNSVTSVDPHTWASIGQLAAAVLIPPPGGLIVAAAIGAADAYKYHLEKNDKMAGVTLLLAALPGITKLAGKVPGLNTLGAKGMALLSDKIAKGITTLAPEEAAVINFIKNNTKLVQTEYQAFVNSVSKKIASNAASYGSSQAVEKVYNFAANNPTFARKLAFGAASSVLPGVAAAGAAYQLGKGPLMNAIGGNKQQIASAGNAKPEKKG